MAGEVKFNSADELRENGDYHFIGSSLVNAQFINENALKNYIVSRLSEIIELCFGDKLISFELEKDLSGKSNFGPRNRRIDLVAKCVNKTYLIELKNPKNLSENRNAIGQILDYGRQFPDPKKELVIISTKFDHDTGKTIKHYNLPIRYFVMLQGKFLEYMRPAND